MIALNLCWIVWIIPKDNEKCLYKRIRRKAHRRRLCEVQEAMALISVQFGGRYR